MATKPKAKQETAPKSADQKKSAVNAEENSEAVIVEQVPESGGQEVTSAVSATQLKDQKWEEIRLLLTKIKEDTLREISKSVRNGTEAVAAIEPGGDIYDQASSERDRELGLLLGDREREKVHNIDEALLRIDEGDYGICEECDEEIPLGRLKAMPFTRHCVKCKSDLEKMQAQTKRVEEERAYREIPIGSEEDEG
ncbi:MAG: TraR/DksA family transcriptional regulator [Geobacteraceae bacterium]|nr:TraR/DksA family transcriptional regulator [Geobacteraceae bacterium]